MEIKVGDVVQLKKKHPCGSDQWQVIRVGIDIGLKCQKCNQRVFLERGVFERRVKAILTTESTLLDSD
ncbi:MAG: DUF951 domain-containing protein [Dehalococcoidia bacterium]